MAEVDKTGVPTISTPAPTKESLITGLLAGEALGGADLVYLKAADGKAWKATGAAANAAAKAIGFTAKPADADEPCTIIRLGSGVMIGYGPVEDGSTTPIAAAVNLFLSGTVAGGLADAASTGGLYPVAYTLGDGRICVDAPASIIAYDLPD